MLAHGAGADMNSEWMLLVEKLLLEKEISVKRFNFPYMQKSILDGKRRPPDRQPKLITAFQNEIKKCAKNERIILAGKSMGGRIASYVACDANLDKRVIGVICMGFPFHPPKKQEKFRGEHLATINIPTLILQGERDTFGNKDELATYAFSNKVQVEILPDGDHSFKPRIKSGFSFNQNLQTACNKIVDFLKRI